jgi:hypothetical protein
VKRKGREKRGSRGRGRSRGRSRSRSRSRSRRDRKGREIGRRRLKAVIN